MARAGTQRTRSQNTQPQASQSRQPRGSQRPRQPSGRGRQEEDEPEEDDDDDDEEEEEEGDDMDVDADLRKGDADSVRSDHLYTDGRMTRYTGSLEESERPCTPRVIQRTQENPAQTR